MKKKINKIINFIFYILVIVLSIYIIGIQFFPEKLGEFVGYRTFVILTDSMEPTIPVGSLVISKNVKDAAEIPKDTIISFRVDRMGDEVVFTHYFKKRELDETGKVRYYTQAENADRYDDYTTYGEDVLGTYVFHIPYVGKFILFLQSPFALLELGIILFIMLINRILWEKFDREEKEALAAAEAENIEDSAEDSDIETEDDSEYLKPVDVEEISEDMEEVQPDEANTDIREEE